LIHPKGESTMLRTTLQVSDCRQADQYQNQIHCELRFTLICI